MKTKLFSMGSAFALCASLFAANAVAQDQSDDEASDGLTLNRVTVTAQKREQDAQDVPIAISAFDANFLDEAGVDDITGLQFFVPGLSVFSEFAPTNTSFRIRGVGTTSTNLALESSVGAYIDGVFRSRQTSAINDLIDVERVEVLKGPQGTLFGKNTAAGAVQFLTVAPQLDEFGGFGELTLGNFGAVNVNGAVNIPIVEDKVAARFTGGFSERDGYVDNLFLGTELNDKNRYSLRGQLFAELGDSVTARLIVDMAEIDEKCCGAGNVFDGPGDTDALFTAFGGGPFPLGSLETIGGQVALANQFDDQVVYYDAEPFSRLEDSGISLELNWDLGDFSLTSLTAYRKFEQELAVETDWTSLDILTSGSDAEQDTFSQEFRIDGSWGDKVNYVAGFYYFDQELDNDSFLRVGVDANTVIFGGATLGILDAIGGLGLPAGVICSGAAFPGAGVENLCSGPAFPGNEGSRSISNQTQESWAIFGQADFQVTDKLVATLGLRYLDEEKVLNTTFDETVFTPTFAAVASLSPFIADVVDEQFSDSATTGTAKLSYFWNDDVMTYVSYGRGYKSGGTNIDRIPPETGAQQIFGPETSDAYEIGIKADLFNNRVRANGAVFFTEFNDFQANNFQGTAFVLQNAGTIETQGFELDVTALVSDWLTVTSGLAHVDATYSDFPTGACAKTPFLQSADVGEPGFPNSCDATGQQVGGTPEWSAYTSLRSEHQFGNGNTGYAQLDLSWRDEMLSGIVSSEDPNHIIDPLTLANLSIGYRFADDRYDVSLWGKNIFDERYYLSSFDSVLRDGSISALHAEPATWGVTLRGKF